MSAEFKLDWHKIEKAAGVRLNGRNPGGMWLDDQAAQFVAKLAASYVETVKRDQEWPSLAELRDRHRAIAATGAKMLELIGADRTYEYFHASLAATIQCAERAATNANDAVGAEPPMASEARAQLIGGFIREWTFKGGEFTGPQDRGPAFRAAIEILTQCRGNSLMTTPGADRKAVIRAFEKYDPEQDTAQISASGIASTY